MSSSTRQMSAIVEVGRNSLAFAKFTAFIRFRIENCCEIMHISFKLKKSISLSKSNHSGSASNNVKNPGSSRQSCEQDRRRRGGRAARVHRQRVDRKFD